MPADKLQIRCFKQRLTPQPHLPACHFQIRRTFQRECHRPAGQLLSSGHDLRIVQIAQKPVVAALILPYQHLRVIIGVQTAEIIKMVRRQIQTHRNFRMKLLQRDQLKRRDLQRHGRRLISPFHNDFTQRNADVAGRAR